jgi:MraZ protein
MGEFQHTIDEKGRLFLPSRFREVMAPGCVVTRGLEECLFVYTMDRWKALHQQLQSLPFTSATNRAFIRFFLSGAVECQPDRQGRVLIPQNLRDHAGLRRDAVIIGVLDRLEIWDQERWADYRQQAGESFEELAEKLDGFLGAAR